MRTLKLTVAYDGSRFAGWQRQKKERSVQATLENALRQVISESVKVVGAGRTDSGVHAEGQVAHAQVGSKIPAASLQRALNAVLPQDVAIRDLKQVSTRFHAQHSAKAKRYQYFILNDSVRPLLDRHRVYHVAQKLNVSAMRRAARILGGRHDFRAFCSEPGGASGAVSSGRSHNGRPVASTVRTVSKISIRKKGKLLVIEATANGFLYHMVRRIAGFLIEVGKGKVAVAQVQELLGREGSVIPPTAPAKGLTLIEVLY